MLLVTFLSTTTCVLLTSKARTFVLVSIACVGRGEGRVHLGQAMHVLRRVLYEAVAVFACDDMLQRKEGHRLEPPPTHRKDQRVLHLLTSHHLYFCTSKASKLSTLFLRIFLCQRCFLMRSWTKPKLSSCVVSPPTRISRVGSKCCAQSLRHYRLRICTFGPKASKVRSKVLDDSQGTGGPTSSSAPQLSVFVLLCE